jgi:hypothetical protein
VVIIIVVTYKQDARVPETTTKVGRGWQCENDGEGRYTREKDVSEGKGSHRCTHAYETSKMMKKRMKKREKRKKEEKEDGG